VASRTLLENNRTQAIARVLNYSDEPYTLAVDNFLAGETDQEPIRNDELETGPTSEQNRQIRPRKCAVKRRDQPRRLSSQRQLATVKSDSSSSDYSHVQCLIYRLPADTTEEQRVHAEEFIGSRSQVFLKSEFDISRTDVFHHHIDTGDNVPHFERLRRHPTCQLPVIDDHVEGMCGMT